MRFARRLKFSRTEAFILRQIEKDIQSILRRYGVSMKLKNEDGETEFKAFLQPLRYKNKMYLSTVSTELAYNSTRKFLLIAPKEIEIERADGYDSILIFGDREFCCDHSELVYSADEAVYCWSIVHRVK